MVSISEAEKNIKTIESQISSRAQQLSTQEQQIRKQFIPGTIESQFEFGSAAALRGARAGLKIRQQESLGAIFVGQRELDVTRSQVAERQAQIESARAVKRAQEDRIRIAKVARKTGLREFGERERPITDQGVLIPEGAIGSLAGGGFLIGSTGGQTLATPIEVKPIQNLETGGILFSQVQIEKSKIDLPQTKFQQFISPLSNVELAKTRDVVLGKVTGKDPQQISQLFEEKTPAPIKFIADVRGAAFEELGREPVKTAIVFGVGGVAGGVVKGAGFAVARFAPSLIPASRVVTTVGGGALGTFFVGSAGLQIASAQPQDRAQIIGEIGLEAGAFGTGFGLGSKLVGGLGSSFATRQSNKLLEGANIQLREADTQIGLNLKSRIKLLEGLDATSARLKLDIPSATGSIVKREEGLSIQVTDKISSKVADAFSIGTLRALSPPKGRDVLKGVDITQSSITISRPQQFDLVTGSQADILKTVNVGKIAPLSEGGAGVFFQPIETSFISASKGIVTESGQLATIGAQFRVGSRGRLVDETFFTLRGEKGLGEFTLFKQPRRTTRKQDGFIIESFPFARIIGKQTVKVSGLQTQEFIPGTTLSRFNIETGLLPSKKSRISAEEFTTLFQGSPSGVKGFKLKEEVGLSLQTKSGKNPFVDFKLDIVPKGLKTSLELGTKQTIGEVTLTRRLPQRRQPPGLIDKGLTNIPSSKPSTALADVFQIQTTKKVVSKFVPAPTLSQVKIQPLTSPSSIFKIPTSDIKASFQPLIATGGALGLKFPTQTGSLREPVFVKSFDFQTPRPRTNTFSFESSKVDLGLATKSETDLFSIGKTDLGLKIIPATITTQTPFLDQPILTGIGTPPPTPTPTTRRPPPRRPTRITPPTRDGLFFPPIVPTLGGFGVKAKPRKRTKRPQRIAPSFTAGVLDLTAFEKIQVSPTFGISPFEIRRKLIKRPKKKKKTKKKKKK